MPQPPPFAAFDHHMHITVKDFKSRAYPKQHAMVSGGGGMKCSKTG